MGSSGGLYPFPDTLSPCWQTSSTSCFCLENSFLWETRIYISIKQLVNSRRTIGKTTMLSCSASQLEKGQSRFTKSLHYMDQSQKSIWKIWYVERDYDEIVSVTMNQITVTWTVTGAAKAHPRESWPELVIIFFPSMNYILSKGSQMFYEPNY